ncbi:DUF3179 domain-containing protein [Halolamina sp.]|jgi:hypothetical protein|uniref:DUF3179 domain-containing protein n=1 Tax=Halolamina sp. TaxID=1940283 RepID=UPI00356213CC
MNVRQVIPKDAIPSVDDPEFVADHPHPDDEVVGVELGGEVTAYPIRYLNYHEIVNDTVGGVPVAATWCPLCGSTVVYDRRPAEGDLGSHDDPGTLEFGVSGKLADDDLVMYDRETGSEWKQSLGEAIAGPLEGARLCVLPATTTTWSIFSETHPEATVMAEPGGKSEASGTGSEPAAIDYEDDPYRDYFEAEGFGLGAHRGEGPGREWDREDLTAKETVLGLELGDDALGFPRSRVEDAGGVVTATVGDEAVVVFAADDGLHAYRDPGYEWRSTRGGFRADGVMWDATTGAPLDNPATHVAANRDPLERLPARTLFAFAWRDDHGDAFFLSG